MKIGLKIGLAFFSLAAISMIVIGYISYDNARRSLEQQSFNKLTAVREAKADQIQDYFKNIEDQLKDLALNPVVINATGEFKSGYASITKDLKLDEKKIDELKNENSTYLGKEFLPRLNKNLIIPTTLKDEIAFDPSATALQNIYIVKNPNPIGEKLNMLSSSDGSAYSIAHSKYHNVFKNFIERFGYYDLFIIDNETGKIVYTVYKEIDFTASLTELPLNHTNLGEAFESVKNAGNDTLSKLVDYEPYHPSYNAHSSFIACPIFDKGKQIGVLAFQMPIDRINSIMTNNARWENVGLGKSGETYLIGEDMTLRNQSRFLIEDSLNYFKMLRHLEVSESTISKIKAFNSCIGLQEVKTVGTLAALKDSSNTKIFPDYRGVSVLSSYKPLRVLGMNWAILSEIDEDEAFAEIVALKQKMIAAFISLLIVVIITSYFMSMQLTKPIKELSIEAEELGNGNLEVEIKTGRKDEIGVLADNFKKMQSSITKLIMDLRHMNHTLEDKVVERTAEVVEQKNIIEEKQKEIIDSILYAKRIQNAILAHETYLQKHLPEYFVLFKPKDHISGDFYWATKKDGRFYLAVCDSTGHGVPGAFMSLLNIAFLNEAITEKNMVEPHEILNHARKRLIQNMSKEGNKDGMDGILVCIDPEKKTYTYSAAHNSPLIIKNNEFVEYHADKMPIGEGIREESFTSHKFDVKEGDMIYLYTDGYADQFGGPKGKKFKYKQLNDLLMELNQKSMNAQKEKLAEVFMDWKGELEQIDDVCVFGIRV
ncbi:MAG: SpoIIE family protein phosphatase [Bacteroidota bacterium]|nr:SpoIIE family protein phosphatase [Bacteroidota bacterium]